MASQGRRALEAFDEMQPEQSGLEALLRGSTDRGFETAGYRQADREDARRRARLPQDRHHLRRLWRGGGAPSASIPFDIVPRIIAGLGMAAADAQASSSASRRSTPSSTTSTTASEILRAGRIPEEADRQNEAFLPGDDRLAIRPAGVYTHIIGVDIVRTGEDEFFVLEDNCAHAVGRLLHAGEPRDDDALFPELFQRGQRAARRELSEVQRQKSLERGRPGQLCDDDPTIALLDARLATTRPISNTPSSPTRWASSWSRRRICASSTAMSLMRTTEGLKQIDVHLPPRRRRLSRPARPSIRIPRSACRGIMDVYRAGNVTIASAPGTGHRRRQGDLSSTCRDHRVLHRPQGHHGEHPDLALRRRRTA